MTKHIKYAEAKTLVTAGIPIMLTGEKGSGKTTLVEQLAKELKLQFYCMSMTRQTTLSHLLGYRSVTGDYIPSQLREAVENGGIFLLDEIDAGDANVLLALNTIENGYVSFPDGVVKLHKDFRIVATANPQDQHEFYVGRNKLDAATLDRFDIIEVPRDGNLEKSLVSVRVYRLVEVARQVLKDFNSSRHISMRDSMRWEKRRELNLAEDFAYRLLGETEGVLANRYNELIASIPNHEDQNECNTLSELMDLMNLELGSKPTITG